MERNIKGSSQTPETISQTISGIVGQFFNLIHANELPTKSSASIFGFKFPISLNGDISRMDISNLVYGSWQCIIKYNKISREIVEKSLLDSTLPLIFEKISLEFIQELGPLKKNYLTELKKRGFENIAWDDSFLTNLRSKYIEKPIASNIISEERIPDETKKQNTNKKKKKKKRNKKPKVPKFPEILNPLIKVEFKDSYQRVINAIVSRLVKAVCDDIFPEENIQPIFGIKEPKLMAHDLESMTMGQLLYGAWQGVIKLELISPEEIEYAMLGNTLPELFKQGSLKYLDEYRRNGRIPHNYFGEVENRGFNTIIWDTEYLKNPQLHFPSLLKGGRYGLGEYPNKLDYGLDHATGYFLSVYDSRLKDMHDESKEVNEIAYKVGVKDGGGSYFDLHTGEGGFGFGVSRDTMAVYWGRYGVPVSAINTMLAGVELPYVPDLD